MKIGFDFQLLSEGIKYPLIVKTGQHACIIGGTGAGKSTLVYYMIYSASYQTDERNSSLPPVWFISDFKQSNTLTGITDFYAEFEDCYDLIKQFYQNFLETPEGGRGYDQILIIDEVAGMLSYFGMNKESKSKADEIRSIMANILMLGRSRRCYLWLVMQRYTASIFPSASGAIDNVNLIVGLGRLTVDSKRSLFAGMELDFEFLPGQGRGIAYIEGEPLRAICVPRIDKEKLLAFMRWKHQTRKKNNYLADV